MEYLTLIIPIIACLFLFWKFRDKMAWWEYIVIIAPCALLVLATESAFFAYNTSDTEYKSYYITSIEHEDEWDEWITQTCTREVPCGTDSKGNTTYCTETYDCSHSVYHPDEWHKINNNGRSYNITKLEYNQIKKSWGVKEQFVEKHRDFYTIDGDAQKYVWDGKMNTISYYDIESSYKNKVKASQSIFNLKKISKEEVKKYKLYEYPTIVNDHQETLIGFKTLPKGITKKMGYVNSMYGRTKQFRMYVLAFYDKDVDVAEMQRCYWENGNKNEFVVCIGLNSKYPDSVMWVDAFSWMDKPVLEVNSEDYLMRSGKLDLPKYLDWTMININKWDRKKFKDFDYLSVELSPTQYNIIVLLVALYSVIMSIYCVLNKY